MHIKFGHQCLPARKRGTCYGNVAGWLAGCHTPVLSLQSSAWRTTSPLHKIDKEQLL